ncbi:hypothetical protein [Falsiroseomonas sp. HW251]|uniref:hypothetical protein n=1 Tax=Falsiroseomonas sp. HW251 TaxID=3390998 RepID=UPI003D31231A
MLEQLVMPALTAQRWEALRAEYEYGSTSTRALAAKHGVSEKAIRKRAASRRDAWQRDGAAIERARARGREATLLALARARSAAEVRTDPAAVATRRAELEHEAAKAIAAANLRHLGMAAMLHDMFETICVLLHGVLDHDDDAKDTLLGRGGSLASAILAAAKLGQAIQTIERKALGMDEVRPACANDADRHREASRATAPDITTLSPDHRAALSEFAASLGWMGALSPSTNTTTSASITSASPAPA